MITVAAPESQPQIHFPAPAPPQADVNPTVFRSRLPNIELSNHLPLHVYCFEKVLPAMSSSPCLISASTGKTYSYADTRLLSRRAAAFLSSRCHVAKGDVIMVLLQNCPEFVFSFLAASVLGAVTTTANPFCTPPEISKQILASRAKIVITHSLYVSKLPRSDDLVVVTVDEDQDPPDGCVSFWDQISKSEPSTEVADVSIDPDDAVAMPFSSGTTGLPKGVVLTHRNLVSSIAQQVDGENPNLYLRAGDDVMLCVLPLFHIFSLNSVLLCGLRAGAAVVIMGRFEMERMLEVIERWRVTVAAVVPPLVLALAKNPVVERYDLGSVRVVLSGAAPLGKELEAALQGRLPQAVLGQVS